MKDVTRNFLVGFTAIIGVGALVALLMLFGELDRFIESRYYVQLFINDAGGLHNGSEVRLNGVRIGNVGIVSLRDDAERPVVVQLRIDKHVHIPASAKPMIDLSLLGGGSVLQLQVPPGPSAYLPVDGTATIDGRHVSIVQQLIEQLDSRMEPLLAALDRFNTTADTYTELGRNLNELVRPQDQQAIADGEPPNFRTAVAKLNKALDDASDALTLARSWLGDDQLRADARAATQKANVLIDRATAAVERYTRLADSFETDAHELISRLTPVADQLGGTLEEVRRVVQEATSGQGTVAQLLNNPDLYNSLNDAAERLEQTLIEARLLIQKIKAEGLPVKF